MEVRIVIAQAANSPTQKVWGYICPAQNPGDAVVFYGPGTRQGGSVYGREHHAAVSVYHKKISGEYSPFYDHFIEMDEGVTLKDAAKRVLLGIQRGMFGASINALHQKHPHQKSETPPQAVSITAERIRSAVSQIQSPDWAF